MRAQSPAGVDPFNRAATSVRAVAVLMLAPAVLVIGTMVEDLGYMDAFGMMVASGIAFAMSAPAVGLAFLIQKVRRARAWAIVACMAGLGIGILVAALFLAGMLAGMFYEYVNWWRGSAMNLRRLGVMTSAMLAFFAAQGLGLIHLGRAERARRVTYASHGFAVQLTGNGTL